MTQLQERVKYQGIVKAYLTPAMTREEWKPWWESLSDSRKEEWQVVEGKNVIIAKNYILIYCGAPLFSGGYGGGLAQVFPFFQYFAVGTGLLTNVSPNDTGMVNELARVVPSLSVVSGNTVTVTSNFSTSQANGALTEAAIWGAVATATLGSGVMMTHALFRVTKTNANTLTAAYVINLN